MFHKIASRENLSDYEQELTITNRSAVLYQQEDWLLNRRWMKELYWLGQSKLRRYCVNYVNAPNFKSYKYQTFTCRVQTNSGIINRNKITVAVGIGMEISFKLVNHFGKGTRHIWPDKLSWFEILTPHTFQWSSEHRIQFQSRGVTWFIWRSVQYI